MHRHLDRSLRFAFVAVAATIVAAPTLPVSAQARLLNVDLPAPNAVVSNGAMVDIGGWTTGSRVDAYLDGPAGVGEGIGSTEVDKLRPDVAWLTGSPESGFDLPWLPMDVTAGSHMLYVYSFVDGVWSFQTVPIIGEGNVVPVIEVERGNDQSNDVVVP